MCNYCDHGPKTEYEAEVTDGEVVEDNPQQEKSEKPARKPEPWVQYDWRIAWWT